MTELILASNNAHKLREIRRILGPLRIQVAPLSDYPEIPDPPEDQDSFEGNALQKARFVAQLTGLPVVADDSGLEVDALNGAPGVRSKRFTPEALAETNNTRLLKELTGSQDRRARFVCALALVDGTRESVVRGTVEGTIATTLQGVGGFGYDPLFLPDATPGRSMAELTPREKDAISHRGHAFRQLPGLLNPRSDHSSESVD
jgi:XTP/dITP diphosphohydrolase